MSKSKIEWTEATWNPITGCTPISAGCTNCYAKRMAETRLRGRCGYPADDPFRVTLHEERLDEPLHWRTPRLVFACSMGDLFHEDVPASWWDTVFARIAATPQHTYQIVTKRSEQLREYMRGLYGSSHEPLPNLHLGVTVEHQEYADGISHLLDTPAAVSATSAPRRARRFSSNRCQKNSLYRKIYRSGSFQMPSKTTHYRRLRKARKLGCDVSELPDNRGRHGNHARGVKHGRWNDNVILSPQGYRKIRVGTNHRLSDPNGYAFEHLVVWVAAGNQRPPLGFVLHHINHDKTDNRLENLEMITVGEHNALHNSERGRDEKGRFIGKKAAGRLLDGREHNGMPDTVRTTPLLGGAE